MTVNRSRWFLLGIILLIALVAGGGAFPTYFYRHNDPGWFVRQSRVAGDLFSRLNAVSQVLHNTEQEGCGVHGDMCSWNVLDNMPCCHRHSCRCNILATNCRCEA